MGQRVNDNALITRTSEVVTANMDGETVMLSVANGKYYGIDEVGSRIWELLATPKTLAELIRLLTDEYEVTEEQCRADVEDFVQYLKAEGLVNLN